MYADSTSHLAAHLERISLLLDRCDPAELDDRIADAEPSLPLCRLADAVGRAGLHVLVAVSLPALDRALAARVAQRLRGDAPRVDELVELLAFAPADEAVLRASIEPMSALGLVSVSRTGSLDVDARIAAFLRGDDVFEPRLRGFATLHRAPDDAVIATDAMAVIGHVARTPGPIVVEGPAGVGKTTTAIAGLCRGARVIELDLDMVAAAPDPAAIFQLARREALLHAAELVIRVRAWAETWPAMFRHDVIATIQDREAIATIRDAEALCRELRGPRRVRVAMPSADDQLAVWRDAIGELDLAAVVARYPLAIGDILAAGAAARAAAELDRRAPTADDALVAARARICHRLGDHAELVDTTLTWEDLVLRTDVDARLREIIGAFRHRDHVMESWGLADKLPYGRALSAMFSGAPGTGKTMVATLIAKELGLEVFRVDLSKIASKYIGETEKNLDRVFAEASRCRAMLLFDEADALFAKRTEVKSSNDRYANLEVNFLLQRLEAHDGVVILTTNAATAIDAAFLRRLRYRVEFPTPDAGERASLWRAMIPRAMPIAADVDFAALGARFNMSGGNIKNAVVRAAYLAASSGATTVDHHTFVRAARLEWSELGNLPDEPLAPAAAPRPAQPDVDACLLDVLTRQPAYGETIEACFHRKEYELGALLAELPVADARAMHRRLAGDPTAGDELATQFSRLKLDRRRRLLTFLADARRRAATTRKAS